MVEAQPGVMEAHPEALDAQHSFDSSTRSHEGLFRNIAHTPVMVLTLELRKLAMERCGAPLTRGRHPDAAEARPSAP